MSISSLPPELVEQILVECDPVDVAAFVQTNRAHYALLYPPPSSSPSSPSDSTESANRLWRLLWLNQSFDDPRHSVDRLGFSLPPFDWQAQLKRLIRARTVAQHPAKCKPSERRNVLQALVDLCEWYPSAPAVISDMISQNLLWIAAVLRGGAFLTPQEWSPPLTEEEEQLRARLHTYYGLTPSDARPSSLVDSRAFVYTMRHYRWDNAFGPFVMDGSGRVNWVHVRAIHHCISAHLVHLKETTEESYTIYSLSAMYCQSVGLPKEVQLGGDYKDWAGIDGMWSFNFCFCDHRELLMYNNFNLSTTEPLDTSVFTSPTFHEVYRSMIVRLQVISTDPADAAHPARPRIHFMGEMRVRGAAAATGEGRTMVGWVKMTRDGFVRWHFVSGEEGHPIWSCEGVQIGGLRSPYGVLGAWTTVFHDVHDPVGPFWVKKIYPEEEYLSTSVSSEPGSLETAEIAL